MKRSSRKSLRPEEIVAMLRQADGALAEDTPLAEVARSLRVTEATLQRIWAEYGAVNRDAMKRLKDLKKEDVSVKRLVSEQPLDIKILKEIANGEY
jgi:putative transposase